MVDKQDRADKDEQQAKGSGLAPSVAKDLYEQNKGISSDQPVAARALGGATPLKEGETGRPFIGARGAYGDTTDANHPLKANEIIDEAAFQHLGNQAGQTDLGQDADEMSK